MLNRYARLSIIALTKYILPVVVLLLLIPQLLHFSPQIIQANKFFHYHQCSFLLVHGLFYLAFYYCWPRIIYFLVKRSNHLITQEQLHCALNAKWYLLTALVFFEVMAWLQ